MYSDIRANKFKTAVIVTIFLIMISFIVYFICYWFGLGEYAVIFAIGVSILTTVGTYYNSDKIVLSQVNARKATHEEDLQLTNILDGLMVASGLTHRPELYVVDSAQPNAFATGRDPEHAVICVTKGLLERLNYYELEGVVAHEMGHIKNYDIRLSCVISVMVGFVVILSDVVLRGFRYRGSSRNRDANPLLMIIGIIFLILSPIASNLIKLAVSRRREYLADATAVSFTRNPDGLISALEKISADPNEYEYASKSTEHMYISNPFKNINKTNIFSTHPSTPDRINAIKNLKY